MHRMPLRLLLLLAAALAACAAPSPDAPALRHVDVNGARLTYADQGRGPLVVLVHGALGDHRVWERQRADLAARGYRAVAYSQRWFGDASWGTDWPKFGARTHADDLAAFLRSLGAGPAHLVGWSLSGHTVLTVAAEHPELVASAFVFEPAAPTYVTDAADLKALTDDRAPLAGPAAQAVKAGDHAGAAKLLIDGVEGRPGAFDVLRPELRSVIADNARTLPLMFAAEPPPELSCAQLGALRPPVTIARGEHTRTFYRTIADNAAKCIGGARHLVVAGARHMWPEAEAPAFVAAVLRTLPQR